MGILPINTPQGLKRIKIEGDMPSNEEIAKLRAAFPDDPDFD